MSAPLGKITAPRHSTTTPPYRYQQCELGFAPDLDTDIDDNIHMHIYQIYMERERFRGFFQPKKKKSAFLESEMGS